MAGMKTIGWGIVIAGALLVAAQIIAQIQGSDGRLLQLGWHTPQMGRVGIMVSVLGAVLLLGSRRFK